MRTLSSSREKASARKKEQGKPGTDLQLVAIVAQKPQPRRNME